MSNSLFKVWHQISISMYNPLLGNNKKDDKILKYEILNWDSEFFGMKVSRIAEPSLKADECADILSELKRKRV